MTNIKNYTSTVPAATSISRIEQYLVSNGASDISKKYDADKNCSSITFRMLFQERPIFFMLKANVQACFKVLFAEIKKPLPTTRQNVMAQAERTAWKIWSDWVEIQFSLQYLEQADLIQIFLPYAYDPEKDQTFYDRVKEGSFKQITNG